MTDAQTRVARWMKTFIVGHQICPFAKRPWTQARVRIRVSDATAEETLVRELLTELGRLVATPRAELETTLLVFPNLFPDFDDFWAFCEWTEQLLVESGAHGLVQLVGFHPDFYFADSDPADLANFTNRAPYPLLHLLREESVEEAVAAYGAVEEIPSRNADYLRGMPVTFFEELLNKHE